MTNQQTTKYLTWALKGVLYLVLLSPLLVSSRFLFPFITTKTMYFRLLVELAVVLYVTLAMIAPQFRPRMTKLSWAVVVFGIIIFITGMTGVDFYKTFWGTIERGEGFLTLSHLIIYFLLLTWFFKSREEWLNYLTGAVVVGLLVDFYAILQRAQVEKFFLFGRIIHSGEGRLSATIGNAAFLGAFTLANFFLSLFLFLKRKQWWWKIILALAALINFYVLFQTQTRGALLAWLVVFILLCLFYALKSPDKTKKYIATGILILALSTALFIWFNKNNQWVQNNNTLHRLVNISRYDITTESRLLATDTSWKGWQDRFILGYGWENYNIAFNKYFHAEIFRDQGSQLWFDRAHNTIFDVAVATGIIGFICYLVIFGLALLSLSRGPRQAKRCRGTRDPIFQEKNKLLSSNKQQRDPSTSSDVTSESARDKLTDFDSSAILAALLIAHFLQNIFVFDVLASYIILFMVLALISFHVLERHKVTTAGVTSTGSLVVTPTDVGAPPQDRLKKPEFNILIFTIVLIIISFAAYIFNIKPLQANHLSVKALIMASADQEKQAVNYFQQAIKKGTYQTPEIRQKLADNIILFNKTKKGLTEAEVYQNFQIAIQEMKNNIAEHPLDVQNYLYLMAVLNKAGAYDAKYYDEIIEWGEKALQLSPTRPQTYFEMGQARVSQKRSEEGIEYFKKGVELNPKTMESHWNLMAAYIIAGQDENAKIEYEFMQNQGHDFNNPNDLNRLYNIYLVAGKKDKLVETLEQLVEVEPSGINYARLAAAYKQIGDFEKARAAVQKAVELDPSLAEEAGRFLESLP